MMLSVVLASLAQAPPAPDIVLEGVTRYDPDQLLHFAVDHVQDAGQTLTDRHLVEAIEIVYREDGYFLAEATAFQREGRWVVHVNEGIIDAVEVHGLDPSDTRALKARFDHLRDRPAPRYRDFERPFLLADDLSGIDLIARFHHDTPDGSVLELHGSRQRGYVLGALDTINIAPETGGRLVLTGAAYGVIATGDKLALTGVGSLEPDNGLGLAGLGSYRAPLGHDGWFLQLRGGTAFGERDFDDLSITSTLRGYQAAAAVGTSVLRTASSFAMLIGEAEYKDAHSRAGVGKVDSNSRALRGFLIAGHTASSGAFVETELSASVGKSDDLALRAPDEKDATYAFANGVFGVSLPMGQASQVQFEIAGQHAFDDLPVLERFYAGHQPSMRGYGLGEAAADSAVVGSLSLDHMISRKSRSQVTGFAFVDAGRFWQRANRLDPADRYSLSSGGIGARAHHSNGWGFETWVAVPFDDGPRTRSGEPVIYARLSKAFAK